MDRLDFRIILWVLLPLKASMRPRGDLAKELPAAPWAARQVGLVEQLGALLARGIDPACPLPVAHCRPGQSSLEL